MDSPGDPWQAVRVPIVLGPSLMVAEWDGHVIARETKAWIVAYMPKLQLGFETFTGRALPSDEQFQFRASEGIEKFGRGLAACYNQYETKEFHGWVEWPLLRHEVRELCKDDGLRYQFFHSWAFRQLDLAPEGERKLQLIQKNSDKAVMQLLRDKLQGEIPRKVFVLVYELLMAAGVEPWGVEGWLEELLQGAKEAKEYGALFGLDRLVRIA